jgi:hypothetical protein
MIDLSVELKDFILRQPDFFRLVKDDNGNDTIILKLPFWWEEYYCNIKKSDDISYLKNMLVKIAITDDEVIAAYKTYKRDSSIDNILSW